MKVAIVHYHFELSGVTKVIEVASRCLTEAKVDHVLLVCDVPETVDPGLPIQKVRGLGYVPDKAVGDPSLLMENLRIAAREQLGSDPDLWHFHNHALGKNHLLAEVVARMAEQGERLVLQMHDLIEEGRQQNYAVVTDPGRLYPTGKHVRYLFLNEQDRELFQEHGLVQQQSEVIVNPINVPEPGDSDPEAEPILFAPIRAIRRKNMGELVMLSALAPVGTRIAISRAPKDKGALRLHETWRKFAGHQRLPIGFDVVDRYHPADGASSDFASWVTHSTHYITTSVAEGFGLTMLEAAALGKPLLGRNIPRVTREHEKHGLPKGDLYDQLLVPMDWVDVSILRQHFDTTIQRNYRYLGKQLDNLTHERAFQSLLHDGWLDFGNMPEPVQQAVVERLTDPSCREEPQVVIDGERTGAKLWLHQVLKKRKNPTKPKQLEPFTKKGFSKALMGIYESAAAVGPGQEVSFLDPDPILNVQLKPHRFHFLSSVIPPRPTSWSQYRAVIFDIYGTLLTSPPIQTDEVNPQMDGLMQDILEQHGYDPPESPTQELRDLIALKHEESEHEYPEVEMREIWREILGADPMVDMTDLVNAIESQCRPVQPMPGASGFIRRLAHSGVALGLLSNGQCNTLRSLGGIRDFFSPELILVSYQQGVAKPSPELFQLMADRLAARGIPVGEALYIGNDPLKDIVPAAACGFKTGLFTGHPDSYRPGNCTPDHEIAGWPQNRDEFRRC